MGQVKNIIEKNFALLLLLGLILGFFVPSLGEFSDEVVIFLTAFLIFLSCADIDLKDFFKVDVFEIGLFTLIRFAILPLVLFFIAQQIIPQFAIGVLLLSLMPAGVAVASLCSMSKSQASVTLGLSITIISSLLAPAFIPSVFSFLGQIVEVDILSLFLTLCLVVLLPIILYFGFVKRYDYLHHSIKKYNKSSAVVVLSLVLMIVIAAQKNEFISNVEDLVFGLFVMFVLFAFYYAFGIVFSFFLFKEKQIPYIFGSGAMNNALAVGLAFAYFDPKTTLFIVISEIVWCLYVAVAQWWFSRSATA